MYYLYKKPSGEYLGSSPTKLPETNVFGVTTKAPPETDRYHIALFDPKLNDWKIVPDYRGVWYNKKTKEKLVITEIGVEIDTTLYTQKQPCDFCVWDETKQDWIFSLELYKNYALKTLLQQYQSYILSRFDVLHLIGFSSLIVRLLVSMISNKSLTQEQVSTLAQYIQESDSVFQWITKVTEYELNLENKIRGAADKSTIDNVLSSLNFNQFDKEKPDVSLADKMIYLSTISLNEER